MLLVYSLLLSTVAILCAPYWIARAIRERKYFANFRQRFGERLPSLPPSSRPVWIHAVSVGEVLAARPLVTALRARHPGIPVIVSTVTLTGQALAQKEFGMAEAIFYFPFDWMVVVSRFFRLLKPRAVVLLETELWPNYLKCAARSHVPVALVNGRISDKSLRRYSYIRWFIRRTLADVAAIGAQSEEDARRFAGLGAPTGRLTVTGNLKYDFADPSTAPEPGWLDLVRTALGATDRVIVAGSTMNGEEEPLLRAFRQVLEAVPDARMVLAPRHPERFDEVAEIIRSSGLSFCRRSALQPGIPERATVVLLDTMGELRIAYTLAAVTIICGSFLPYGGHNILEPAALEKAVLFGPHMSNFRAMAALFCREQAARQCSLQELAATLISLLRDDETRTALGRRAAMVLKQNRGATDRTLRLLEPFLG